MNVFRERISLVDKGKPDASRATQSHGTHAISRAAEQKEVHYA